MKGFLDILPDDGDKMKGFLDILPAIHISWSEGRFEPIRLL
jgi:hypothetical protein